MELFNTLKDMIFKKYAKSQGKLSVRERGNRDVAQNEDANFYAPKGVDLGEGARFSQNDVT